MLKGNKKHQKVKATRQVTRTEKKYRYRSHIDRPHNKSPMVLWGLGSRCAHSRRTKPFRDFTSGQVKHHYFETGHHKYQQQNESQAEGKILSLMIYRSGKTQAQILKFPTRKAVKNSRKKHIGRGRPRRQLKSVNGSPGLRCPRCKETKALDNFYLRKGPKGYYSSYCKKCHKTMASERYRRKNKPS